MKVLVVDDDPISRKLLRTYLEKWGYQVTQAEDGAVGWSLFQTDDFPLVIADWMMPEMDGVELVRRIRAHERPGFVYCILLTARSHKEDLVEGMDAGADDFLSKPFDRDELRVRLREGERIVTLERAAAQQTPATGPAAPESAGDAGLGGGDRTGTVGCRRRAGPTARAGFGDGVSHHRPRPGASGPRPQRRRTTPPSSRRKRRSGSGRPSVGLDEGTACVLKNSPGGVQFPGETRRNDHEGRVLFSRVAWYRGLVAAYATVQRQPKRRR